MKITENVQNTNKLLKTIHLSLAIGLFVLVFLVMRPFIVPLLWSAVFAILFLPAFKKLNNRLSNRPSLAAFIITFLAFVFFNLAIIPLFWHLGRETLDFFKSLENLDRNDIEIWLVKIESFPVIGPAIRENLINRLDLGLLNVYELLAEFKGAWLGIATSAFTNILALLFAGFFTFLSLFFLLANSLTLSEQIRKGALILGGSSYLDVVVSAYETVRATLHGILLTSLAQGSLAGVAYFIAGAPYPILLTILTALFSLIPFGPPFIYIPVAIIMFINDAPWFEILLFLTWCVGVVSTVDNILRPYFISQSTKVPFLLLLFGIIGGISSFGFIGVFIGPVTIVIATHLWSNLLNHRNQKSG